MAIEAAIGDEVLRDLMRALLRDSSLPREAPAQLWAGAGSGLRCDVCGHVIAAAQTEYELLFTRAIDPCLHLHRTCYEMWEAERRS